MADANVWILAGYQSDFARNLIREGVDFAGLTAEVVTSTLYAAKIDAVDVGVVHVGNAFGEMFAAQGHLGAMPATVVDGLAGEIAREVALVAAEDPHVRVRHSADATTTSRVTRRVRRGGSGRARHRARRASRAHAGPIGRTYGRR